MSCYNAPRSTEPEQADLSRLGVCILNRNAGSHLQRLVDQLTMILPDPYQQLVVVDNDSADGSIFRVLAAHPQLTVIFNQRNLGYAAGNNVGASLLVTRFGFLVFINPDVTLQKKTLSQLVKAFARDSSLGCVGGVPMALSGGPIPVARTRPTPFQQLLLSRPIRRILPKRHYVDRCFMKIDDVSEEATVYALAVGACVMSRTTAFIGIGGFDEGTFLYNE